MAYYASGLGAPANIQGCCISSADVSAAMRVGSGGKARQPWVLGTKVVPIDNARVAFHKLARPCSHLGLL
jgi:hypothetical protein